MRIVDAASLQVIEGRVGGRTADCCADSGGIIGEAVVAARRHALGNGQPGAMSLRAERSLGLVGRIPAKPVGQRRSCGTVTGFVEVTVAVGGSGGGHVAAVQQVLARVRLRVVHTGQRVGRLLFLVSHDSHCGTLGNDIVLEVDIPDVTLLALVSHHTERA